jgi:hypothetical protein
MAIPEPPDPGTTPGVFSEVVVLTVVNCIRESTILKLVVSKNPVLSPPPPPPPVLAFPFMFIAVVIEAIKST